VRQIADTPLVSRSLFRIIFQWVDRSQLRRPRGQFVPPMCKLGDSRVAVTLDFRT
jgi:hypothetical protein